MLFLRSQPVFKIIAFLILLASAFMVFHGYAHIHDEDGGHEGMDCAVCRLAGLLLFCVSVCLVRAVRPQTPFYRTVSAPKGYLSFIPSVLLGRAPPFSR